MSYKGSLTKDERDAIDVELLDQQPVRGIARSLDLPYGKVRRYVESLETPALPEPPSSPAMLVIDIENTANLVWAWQLYNMNAIDVEEYWWMLSFAYGWYDLRSDTLGDVHFVSNFQDPNFKPDDFGNDHHVVNQMWTLLDQADIVIGQNSKSFDTKKFNARAVIHNYLPPRPYQQVDTKRAAQEVGRFTSNSLKHLSRELGIALKEENRGWPLWRGCIAGDPEMWAEMESYNKADVVATAALYSRLRPWMTGRNHPNLGLYISAEGMVCTHCANKERDEGGEGFQYRGYRRTNASQFPQVRCNNCGAYSREYKRVPQRSPITRVELRP